MATVGTILKIRREELKLTAEDIGAKTKVGLKFLTAIENDSYDQLPPLSYTLGFVRLYAEAVGLDAGAVSAQFKREAKPQDAGRGQPDEQLPDHNVIKRTVPVWLPLAVLGVIIIILFAYFGWLRATPAAKTPAASNSAIETTSTGTPR